MMVKKINRKKTQNTIIFLFVLLFSVNLFSQNTSRNIFFAEASGVTGIYSVNYERLLKEKRNHNFGIRAGISFIPYSKHYNSLMVFPVSISYIKNVVNNHFMEIRVGLSNSFNFYKDWSGRGLGDSTNNYSPPIKLGYTLIPSIGLGYRYQPLSKGLFLNILAQRIVYFSEDHWYGNISVGIGYTF